MHPLESNVSHCHDLDRRDIWLAVGDDSLTVMHGVYTTDDVQSLLVGDSALRITGTLYYLSDCRPRGAPSVSWMSEHPSTVVVDSAGWVRDLAPGQFTVVGITEADIVRAEGFVWPRGWTAQLTPDSATVRVGDSVSFMTVARSLVGGALPILPYWLQHQNGGVSGPRTPLGR